MPSQNTDDFPDELAPDTLLLHGQYQIESYLIRGGFGITYLARDSLDRRVVIKECFPSMICGRQDGQVHAKAREDQDQYKSLLRHFLREARRMARLSHPNIVGVHQVFEENSTAYMALDHVDGMDLLSVIEEDPGRLTPDLVRSLLMKSLGAISYIHGKGILHRDISPDNLMLDGDDNLTLIDFGAAREHVSRGNRALSSLLAVKDGYSPQEFYLGDASQNPASDLYALGATFYHLITGQAPPDSQQRLAAMAADRPDPLRPLIGDGAGHAPDFLNAINRSLAIFPEDRIQSAQDWVESIDPERRRQAAMARASKDKSIRVRISQLVAETNRSLRAPPPPKDRTANRAKTPHARFELGTTAPAKKEKPACKPVDIFGEPIDDVEAWLWAQDNIAKEEAQKEKPPQPSPPPCVARVSPRPAASFKSMPRPDTTARPPFNPTPRPLPKPRSIRFPDPAAKPPPRPSRPDQERPSFLRSLIGRISSVAIHPPRKPAKPPSEKELP